MAAVKKYYYGRQKEVPQNQLPSLSSSSDSDSDSAIASITWNPNNLVPVRKLMVLTKHGNHSNDNLKARFSIQNNVYVGQKFAWKVLADRNHYKISPPFGVLHPSQPQIITVTCAPAVVERITKDWLEIVFHTTDKSQVDKEYWDKELKSPTTDGSIVGLKFVSDATGQQFFETAHSKTILTDAKPRRKCEPQKKKTIRTGMFQQNLFSSEESNSNSDYKPPKQAPPPVRTEQSRSFFGIPWRKKQPRDVCQPKLEPVVEKVPISEQVVERKKPDIIRLTKTAEIRPVFSYQRSKHLLTNENSQSEDSSDDSADEEIPAKISYGKSPKSHTVGLTSKQKPNTREKYSPVNEAKQKGTVFKRKEPSEDSVEEEYSVPDNTSQQISTIPEKDYPANQTKKKKMGMRFKKKKYLPVKSRLLKLQPVKSQEIEQAVKKQETKVSYVQLSSRPNPKPKTKAVIEAPGNQKNLLTAHQVRSRMDTTRSNHSISAEISKTFSSYLAAPKTSNQHLYHQTSQIKSAKSNTSCKTKASTEESSELDSVLFNTPVVESPKEKCAVKNTHRDSFVPDQYIKFKIPQEHPKENSSNNTFNLIYYSPQNQPKSPQNQPVQKNRFFKEGKNKRQRRENSQLHAEKQLGYQLNQSQENLSGSTFKATPLNNSIQVQEKNQVPSKSSKRNVRRYSSFDSR